MLILNLFSYLILLWSVCEAEVLVTDSKCVDDGLSEILQSSYHAPARKVKTNPRVNPDLRRRFLMLFRRTLHEELDASLTNPDGSPRFDPCKPRPLPIDAETIRQINEMVCLNCTFYDFASRHSNGTQILQRVLMGESSAEKVLQTASDLLLSRLVHPTVWYYSLLSVILMRPDLASVNVAGAVDAQPDQFFPYTTLVQATSRQPHQPSTNSCTTAIGVRSTEVSYPRRTPQAPSGMFAADVLFGSANITVPPRSRRARGRFRRRDEQRQQDGYDQTGYTNRDPCLREDTGYTPSPNPGPPYSDPPKYNDDYGHHPHEYGPTRPKGYQEYGTHTVSYTHHPRQHDYGSAKPKGYHQYRTHSVTYDPAPHYHTIQYSKKSHKKQPHRSHPPPSKPFFDLDPFDFSAEKDLRLYGSFRIRRDTKSKRTDRQRRRRQQNNGTNSNFQGQPNRTGQCVLYNGTRGATGHENLLWYFREDVMVNSHHLYWHKHFQQGETRTNQRLPWSSLYERRGEIFFFMHHNIMSRYQTERLSNGLARVTPSELRLGANIGEGYDSGMYDFQSSAFWTPRLANMPMSDISHEANPDFRLSMTMSRLSEIYKTFEDHVGIGFLVANRTKDEGPLEPEFPLNIKTQEGLSHLGNTLEATKELSANPQLYHSLGVHKLGHQVVGLAIDPDFRCKRRAGVLVSESVAMRDPGFYKIHGLVDSLYIKYKNTLGPYELLDGEWPLAWEGVKIKSVEMISANGVGGVKSNLIKTFWSIREFPLEEGVDGRIHEGEVRASICSQHLNHEEFMFRLIIDVTNCAKSVSKKGTVRIFLAPRNDVDGRRFGMEETRKLMFQLDAFPVELSKGRNTITRRSKDSSLTRPWSRTLSDMLNDPENGGEPEACGCGWPRHLYLPKGSPNGMEFDLFAMVTNFDSDQVLDSVIDLENPEPCNSPYLLCGIPYRRYPDARPMGYPFDRVPYNVIDSGTILRPVHDLEEYVTHVPNMDSSVVVIQHVDTVMGQ